MKLTPPIASLAVALAVALAGHGAALAGEKADVKMPDTMTIAGKPVVLNGMGVREATVFDVNVYVAGLYLEKKSQDPKEIINSEQVKRIDIKFVRDVDRDDITEAWSNGFKKNGGNMAKYKASIDQLNKWMPEIEEGDRMIFTYVPGRGVVVWVKGAEKGTLPGAEFGHSFFAIWMGDSPPNKGLKKGMLGK